jgi:prevent-host-death family protein
MPDLPIFEAKNQFARLVHEAESGDSIRLTRHGRPAAMLIGMDEYERLRSSDVGLYQRLEKWREEWAMVAEVAEASDPFAGLRSADPGRPVEL